MKNFKSTLTAKSLVVGAALTIALTGGSALAATRAIAQDIQPAAQEQVMVAWTRDAGAEDAARAVGLVRFGVPGEVVLGDMRFADPAFAHAGGAAQATYESGACALIVRKGNAGQHSARLSDRAESEFANKWTQDVDGLSVSLLGATHGNATVLSWKDGGVEYGVTYQGLGGDEMSMGADDAARVVRAIRDANADPAKAAQPQQASQTHTQQQASQAQTQQSAQPAQQQASPAEPGVIGTDAAIAAASAHVAGDNNVGSAAAELKIGGDAPHYVVTFHFDDADYCVEVDAYTGAVWDARAIFNDGATERVEGSWEQREAERDKAEAQVEVADGGQAVKSDSEGAAAQSQMISSATAIANATSSVGATLVDDASAYLVTGGDAAHYVVTFTFGDASYMAEVDAYSGAVWSCSASSSASKQATMDDDAKETRKNAVGDSDEYAEDYDEVADCFGYEE